MDIASQKLVAFFATCPVLSYKKRSLIIKGGEEPKGVMYIQSGYVRLYLLSRFGEEQTTMIFKPSDLFPLTWAMSGKENKYRFFESLTPVTLSYCPRLSFLRFMHSRPDVSYMITRQILFRFDDLLERMAYISISTKARTKILVLLFLLCQRFGTGRQNAILSFPLTHQDIASFLGITRETVSIVLKKLVDEKLVFQKKHLVWMGERKKLQKEAFLKDLLEA